MDHDFFSPSPLKYSRYSQEVNSMYFPKDNKDRDGILVCI